LLLLQIAPAPEEEEDDLSWTNMYANSKNTLSNLADSHTFTEGDRDNLACSLDSSITNQDNTDYALDSAANTLEMYNDLNSDQKYSYEVTHNSITISWSNGNSNGASIDSYGIEISKIKMYAYSDVITAKDARYKNMDNEVLMLSNALNNTEIDVVRANRALHSDYLEHMSGVLSESIQQQREQREQKEQNELKLLQEQEVKRVSEQSMFFLTDEEEEGGGVENESENRCVVLTQFCLLAFNFYVCTQVLLFCVRI
jgi:hypothetical protein